MPTVDQRVPDGSRVARGDVLAVLTGPVQVLLVAERTLLNLASRASGVATHTRRWADALEGTGAQVLDTRKTTPGLRALEKYAVRCGGGTNKRMGLYDVAMVKDNHVVAAGSVSAAIEAVRARFPDVTIQVEADTLDQALEAVDGGRAVPAARQHADAGARARWSRRCGRASRTASSSRRPATSRWTARGRSPRPGSTTCRSAGSRTRRRSSTWRSTWSRCGRVTHEPAGAQGAGKIAR